MPIGAAFVCIVCTRTSASKRLGHGAPVFTSDLHTQRFCCEHAGPLRHVHGFPVLGLLRVLRPTSPASTGNASSRPPPWLGSGGGTNEMVPTFILEPFNGVGAQLCPCNLATPTPQAFNVAPTGDITRSKVPFPNKVRARNPAQIHQVRAGGFVLRSVQSLVPHIRLSVLLAGPGPSDSAGPSRRCRGCFHPPGVPRIRLPSASTRLLRQTHGGVLSPPQGSRTPVALGLSDPQPVDQL